MSSLEQQAPETAPVAPVRTKKRLLRLQAAVALPLLLGAAALAYWFMIDGIVRDALLSQSISYAGKGGNAEVEKVSFTIFGPKLKVEQLRAWQNLDDGKEHEVVYVKEAVFDMEFWPLLERRVVVNQLTASQVRWHAPISDKPEPVVQDTPPTDTSNGTLNDYLKQAQDILNSEELRTALEWIDKLKQYTDEHSKSEPQQPAPGNEPAGNQPTVSGPGNEPATGPATAPGETPAETPAQEVELGPARRAAYVEEALAKVGAQPRFVLKLAGVDELNITWGSAKKERFARKVTDLLLSAQDVTSDPVAYGKQMQFKAEGNLDGQTSRRVTLGLKIRFDARELMKLEQVDSLAGLKTFSLKGLVDTALFGDTLYDCGISLTHFSSSHLDYASRTRLMLSGGIAPPGFDKPGKASFSLWFGGYRSDKVWTAFVPSGIGVQVENFPLQGLAKMIGGSPLPLQDGPATISFGTCDAAGNFGTPQAAMTWHDGFKVRLRLTITGMRFKETKEDVGGAPGALVVKGLNRVLEGLGGLDVIVGFEGSKDRIALGLERPGLRAFFDALVNALEVSPQDLEGIVELPFALDGNAKIGLASVNADGSKRDPRLNLSGETRHDLNDLRVALNLSGVNLKPKTGQDKVLGLPAEDFCRAFNAFLGQEGGLQLRTRIFDGKGAFSPALESPGLRGLVDAMAGVLSYTGAQINSQFNLPMLVSPDATVRCASVNADGTVRGLHSAGADSDSLGGLRLVLKTDKLQVQPKPGQGTIWGLPAADFCAAFNEFANSPDGTGLAFTFGIFDDKAVFAPSLISPGARGLVDALAGVLRYSGAAINSQFKLPVTVNADAVIRVQSIDPDGTVRGFSSPGADSMSLSGLRLRLQSDNLRLSPKPGESTVWGLPAADFCEAFNTFAVSDDGRGLAFTFALFDAQNTFTPTMVSPGARGLVDALAGVLSYSGAQVNQKFSLPVNVPPETRFRVTSVDEKGLARGLNSPGAESMNLDGLRLRLGGANFAVIPKPGQSTVLGLPAGEFCTAMNSYIAAQGERGLALDFAVLDGKGQFAPALKSPGVRGLMDSVVGTLKYSGKQLNQSFNLPFELIDVASAEFQSVDAAGKPRTMASPGADASDLKDFRVFLILKNGFCARKKGVETVMGVPADYFTFAWNKLQSGVQPGGMPLTLRLFDDKGAYSPGIVKPDEKDTIKLLGSAVGIDDFGKNFGQLATKYADNFPDFQKRGIDAAKDISSGKIKLPGTGAKKPDDTPEEKPKVPDIPKVKLPWEK